MWIAGDCKAKNLYSGTPSALSEFPIRLLRAISAGASTK